MNNYNYDIIDFASKVNGNNALKDDYKAIALSSGSNRRLRGNVIKFEEIGKNMNKVIEMPKNVSSNEYTTRNGVVLSVYNGMEKYANKKPNKHGVKPIRLPGKGFVILKNRCEDISPIIEDVVENDNVDDFEQDIQAPVIPTVEEKMERVRTMPASPKMPKDRIIRSEFDEDRKVSKMMDNKESNIIDFPKKGEADNKEMEEVTDKRAVGDVIDFAKAKEEIVTNSTNSDTALPDENIEDAINRINTEYYLADTSRKLSEKKYNESANKVKESISNAKAKHAELQRIMAKAREDIINMKNRAKQMETRAAQNATKAATYDEKARGYIEQIAAIEQIRARMNIVDDEEMKKKVA